MYSLSDKQVVKTSDDVYYVVKGGTYDPYDLVPCSAEPEGSAIVQFLAVYIATGKNEE
jgi:hypothetical protein